MFENIKKCYQTIIVLAGADKKDFLDKEVSECEEKRAVIEKCNQKLIKLTEYNDQLIKSVNHGKELNDWALPTDTKLKEITTDPEMSPEDRVKEILILQEQAQAKLPEVEPLDKDFKTLLTEEDMEKSETAKNTMASWNEIKQVVVDVCADVEKEAGSISADQRFYADYLCVVKEFTPWMEATEAKVKAAQPKPGNLDDALALLEKCKTFDAECGAEKEKLNSAGKAREAMEKASSSENLVGPLSERWEAAKKIAVDRVEKAEVLVKTWEELKKTSDDLTSKMAEVPAQENPNIEDLEKVFGTMKELYSKKKELLGSI